MFFHDKVKHSFGILDQIKHLALNTWSWTAMASWARNKKTTRNENLSNDRPSHDLLNISNLI